MDRQGAVQYIGLATSLADHSHCVPEAQSSVVKFRICSDVSRQELQLMWKSWIKEHGAIPPGNKPGETLWTQRAPQGAMQAPLALRKASDHSNEIAAGLITQDAMAKLANQGYVVLDGALSPSLMAEALAESEALLADGVMKYVDGGSQVQLGRQDMVCVLDEHKDGSELLVGNGMPDGRGGEAMQPLQRNAKTSALAQVAAVLKGLPQAIMDCAGEMETSAGLGLPSLAVPHSLMLAVYPGEGARYVPHLDNDTEDPRTTEGPPGQRICDRAVTSIVYFNDDWTSEDGGCLRVQKLDGSGHEDVAPCSGRLVVFMSTSLWHEVLPANRTRWALSAWIPKEL